MTSYMKQHTKAQANGESGYIDPDSGLFVMTEATLRSRGKCCGNGCRHCPYGRSLTHAGQKQPPTLFSPSGAKPISPDTVVLFWSGGKDSFLAFVTLQEQYENIVWMTTYANDMVGHQEIHISTIKEQAKACSVPLILVPLANQEPYEKTIERALKQFKLRTLAFGDLHLRGIRAWRERFFASYTLLFPIWEISYQLLQEKLFRQNVVVRLSAVQNPNYPFAVGDIYNSSLIAKLEKMDIDTFGENGEFHTVVHFNPS